MTYIDDQIQEFDLQTALEAISPERREYALRFKHELGQRQCVAAYLLLQRALLNEFGIKGHLLIEEGPHGKPVLRDYPDIHFNLSHCREAVACIVGTEPVGIDIECIDRYREQLVAYTMNEQEQQEIAASADPEVAFVRLWTMKESLLKLTGQGITDDLRTVLQNAETYQFHTIVHPRYVCTSAVLRPLFFKSAIF